MLTLKEIQSSKNLTPFIGEGYDFISTYLARMAQSVIRNYKIDMQSREVWEKTIDKAMEIAKQVMEEKNFPWPKASNIKMPLITEAAINFASRVYPEVLPNTRVVQAAVQGKDLDGMKFARGLRISDCMSYQLLSSPDWCAGVDHLLHILPVVGTVFKKTYYSETEKRNISEVCSPKDVVVNYHTRSIDTARRITHKIKLSINEVIERQRRGLFNEDVTIDELRPDGCSPDDEDFEIDLLEQHCWWDLDEDGYKEPYIVIVSEKALKVLRIVSIIDEIEKIDGEVVRITSEKYFTDFHFIPSPDGGYYSLGYGHLLLPINHAVNTLTNQLIDNGTLLNTQGGFISKGLRLRDGDLRFKPYEYKVVDAAPGDKLADGIYPFPIKEPSSTLYNLLTFLIDMAKDLTKSTEALDGAGSGSNVSNNVMSQQIEQGSKIFSAIYRRFLEAMSKEYHKLYNLNYYNLTNKEYREILDDEMADVKTDFEYDSCDVRPVADPIYSSMQQRLSKIQVLMNLRTINPQQADLFALQAMQFDENQIKQLMSPPPPAPPPAKDEKDSAAAKNFIAQAKLTELQAMQLTQQAPIDFQHIQLQMKMIEAQVAESAMRIAKMQADIAHNEGKLSTTAVKMQAQENLKQEQAAHNQTKDAANIALQDKALNLKAAEAALNASLESKKIDKMAEKKNEPRQE